MACYAVTRRDSLDLAAPHEPLVMDDPFDPPPPPSSPKLIVDRAGVALDQPDVLLLEGPRFRRKSVKFQERAFGILNPPAEPAAPQSGRLLVELNGECHFEPSAKRKTLRSVLKRDAILNRNPEVFTPASPTLVASPTKVFEQPEIKLLESPVSVAQRLDFDVPPLAL
tara:strand:+ start:19 stop:522 length:504 start_codon:yes stop_codon:yes gene_type:complete